MKHYCDTSILASLYLEDARTSKIVQWIQQEASLPLPLPSLAELELTGAIQQQLFRKQISSQEASKCHYYFQQNLNQGTYKKISFQGEEYSEALQLVHMHTATIGCRTLDILHVASALLLGVREFVTCDVRQKSLAEKVGIQVIFFK